MTLQTKHSRPSAAFLVITSMLTAIMPLNAAEPQPVSPPSAVVQATETASGEKKPIPENGKKVKEPKKRTIRLAEDKEDALPAQPKDPATYELSNKKLIEDYTNLDRAPYDRGEHILISALMGGLGGGVVGGMIGLNGFDKNNETTSLNSIYAFGGAGAGVGVVTGIALTFFEKGKIEQFAIGKFLLKYSWYGAIGGGLLGAGVGLIPYSSSSDYSDILRYGGYGAGVGLVAGLVLFFVDLPAHLKLYSYQRDGQNVMVLTLKF